MMYIYCCCCLLPFFVVSIVVVVVSAVAGVCCYYYSRCCRRCCEIVLVGVVAVAPAVAAPEIVSLVINVGLNPHLVVSNTVLYVDYLFIYFPWLRETHVRAFMLKSRGIVFNTEK